MLDFSRGAWNRVHAPSVAQVTWGDYRLGPVMGEILGRSGVF